LKPPHTSLLGVVVSNTLLSPNILQNSFIRVPLPAMKLQSEITKKQRCLTEWNYNYISNTIKL
jgi:hypothetical protein